MLLLQPHRSPQHPILLLLLFTFYTRTRSPWTHPESLSPTWTTEINSISLLTSVVDDKDSAMMDLVAAGGNEPIRMI